MALILALETATKVASAALCEADKLLCEINIQNGYTHSVALMQAVEQCLLQGGKTLADLDAVAVSVGPGSFTGVRIGVATAKALCHGSGKKLLAVSTLRALADSSAETCQIGRE
jgi:tRNA threonylcarbamoyladenosine biosynthesis protein TsaB